MSTAPRDAVFTAGGFMAIPLFEPFSLFVEAGKSDPKALLGATSERPETEVMGPLPSVLRMMLPVFSAKRL